MRYIVYTEVHNWDNGTVERWYYGCWADRDKANEVALELGCDRAEGIWHCVCREDEAEGLGIHNMWG